jgi:hypothetical protein
MTVEELVKQNKGANAMIVADLNDWDKVAKKYGVDDAVTEAPVLGTDGKQLMKDDKPLFQYNVYFKAQDTDIITEERLTELFLKAIDPLSLNKQGEDEGTRYRTGVYFVTEAQVPGISAALDRCAAALGQPLAVELLPLKNFYRAEEYHQDYLEKNPTGYCHLSPAIFRIAEEA